MRNSSFTDIVLSVEARPAKEKRLIQLADILLGAIGYQWCNEYNPEKCNGKKYICDHICERLGKENLQYESNWSDRRINIFKLCPGKKKKRPEPY